MSHDSHNRAQVYKHRAISAVKWTSVSSAVSTGLYILQSVVLFRLLDPGDLGLMAMATVVISVAQAYVDMGLSSAIIQRQHCTENELNSLYWLNIAAGVIVCGLVCLIAPVFAYLNHEPRLDHIIQWCSLAFVLAPMGMQYQLLLQKELFFRPLAIIDVTGKAAGCIMAIALALRGAGVYALVFGQLATYAMSTLLLVIRGNRIYRPRLHFAWADVRSYLSFGLYQMGERAINTLHDNLDKMLIGFWFGKKALGYYSFAWNLALVPVSKINPILTRTAFPLFSRLQDDIALLRAGYFKLIRLLGISNFPMFFGLCALAPIAVPTIYGAKWDPAVPIVQVLAILGAFYSTGNPVGSLVLARGRPDLGFWWQVWTFLAQAIVVVLSAKFGGVMSLAVALLALQVALFFASYWFLIRAVAGHCWSQYIRSVIPALSCSALMMCALMASRLLTPFHSGRNYFGLITLTALGSVIYLILALTIMGDDIRQLFAMVLRRGTPAPQPAAVAMEPERAAAIPVQDPELNRR